MARNIVAEYLQRWLDDCVIPALTTPVGRAYIGPGGEQPWDDCCDGQAWIRLVQMVGVPIRAGVVGCAVIGWDATVEVGVIRCAHVVDDQGVAPTAAEMTADAYQVLQDEADVLEAVQCCIKPLRPPIWTPLGVDGGCVGGRWTFIVRIPNCACP